MRFLLWFSQSEQVQRYWQVKANAFARAPAIPARLLLAGDKYRAYLYRSVMPGTSNDPPKSAGEMLSTEGVVAHLFWRLVTTPALGERIRDDAFYDMFGARVEELTPLENVYLKIFHALAAGKPSDTAGLLRAYVRAFPDEAQAVHAVVREALLGQALPDAPEILAGQRRAADGDESVRSVQGDSAAAHVRCECRVDVRLDDGAGRHRAGGGAARAAAPPTPASTPSRAHRGSPRRLSRRSANGRRDGRCLQARP